MRRIPWITWVVLSLIYSCAKSDKQEQKAASVQTVTGAKPGPEGAATITQESKAQGLGETGAQARSADLRPLLGPFESIAGYCASRPAGARRSREDYCGDEAVAGIEGPMEIRDLHSPYRSVRFFAEGAKMPDTAPGLRCSLGIEVATGWFVLPTLLDCQATSSERAQVLELAVAGSASKRYVRLVYRSAPPATRADVETSGTRDHLLLCGPVKKGKMACLPEIVLRSSVVATSKTEARVEKYLLDATISEGRVATSLKMGSLPAPLQLVAYALPFVVPETLDALALYRNHLRAGRKLAKSEKYSDAALEFEKALEASDGGRAQSELGYAAYRAGDLKKSREASLRAADSSDPRLAAASLYNLGLAQEGLGRVNQAIASYSGSLQLRPNQTVVERRAGLNGAELGWSTFGGCQGALLSPDEVIACYGDDDSEDEEAEDSSFPTGTTVEIVDQGSHSLVKVRNEDGHGFGTSSIELAKMVDDKFMLLATVGETEYGQEEPTKEVYIGFAIALSKFETEKVGDKTVTRVEYIKTSTSDAEEVAVVSTREHRVVFCVAEANKRKCTYPLPLGLDWSATLAESASQLDVELFELQYEKPSPVAWSYRLQASRVDGVVTLSAVRGLRAFEASYRLWP